MDDPQPCFPALIYPNHLPPSSAKGASFGKWTTHHCSRQPCIPFRTIRLNAQTVWCVRLRRPLDSLESPASSFPNLCGPDRPSSTSLLWDDSSLAAFSRTTDLCMPKRQLTRASRAFQRAFILTGGQTSALPVLQIHYFKNPRREQHQLHQRTTSCLDQHQSTFPLPTRVM